ncbi:MAG: response regulator transcription factor [Bdellovibrionales bacterium]
MSHKNQQELLDYLPHIKSFLKEWLFVDVRLTENSDKDFTIGNAAELLHALFESKEGKLYICNDREILMLLRWGARPDPARIARSVEEKLPQGSCDVHVHESTPEGIAKFEMLITYRKPVSLADIRRARTEKIVLVADDDMYMRMLVKKGAGEGLTVHEAADGKDILSAYKKHVPDMLLLDIHMPNMDGTAVLRDVLAVDPKAYVIMLSADSSRENVEQTLQKGAKGFLTKPFTKEKLQEYIRKCPTIARLAS